MDDGEFFDSAVVAVLRADGFSERGGQNAGGVWGGMPVSLEAHAAEERICYPRRWGTPGGSENALRGDGDPLERGGCRFA